MERNTLIPDFDNLISVIRSRDISVSIIVQNISQLEQFETNCIGCNRYKRNCSILHSAIEGRIQDDTIDFQCLKYKKQNKV